jgi:hypothetical protein
MEELTRLDLAPITRSLRATYGSRLLVAAVHHLKVFDEFSDGPLTLDDLRRRLNLRERPTMVLVPALCAMGLLAFDSAGRLALTAHGRFLTSASTPSLAGYIGLEGEDPGVVEMVRRLRHDGPLEAAGGVAYVKEGAGPSPMDEPETARALTLGLAGRARYLSPIVAAALPRSEGHLLDVAGGTGLFAYEWLLVNSRATATVFDRPEVLKVAAEFLDEFCGGRREGASGVRGRVNLRPGDMLEDELPQADVVLAASLFHDWPGETCQVLAGRFAGALKPGGELWIHDAFLDDTMDGPAAVTDYSAQLFWVTKGRAYSRREYREWLSRAGLTPAGEGVATLMDYGLISAKY